MPLKTIRDQLTDKCVHILTAYRKHCASSTSPGQLILPESFKLYPLYTLSLLKSRAFRPAQESTDLRVYHMRTLKSMSVSETIPLFYPRMIAVHDLPPSAGLMMESGRIRLPACIRVSVERLDPQGAYLIENGQQMMLWLGRQVPSEFLQQLFNVETVENVDINM
ncbi:COPII coat Sec23p-Sfb3p heterodimer component, partial [Quaeritorhiza haematococci]